MTRIVGPADARWVASGGFGAEGDTGEEGAEGPFRAYCGDGGGEDAKLRVVGDVAVGGGTIDRELTGETGIPSSFESSLAPCNLSHPPSGSMGSLGVTLAASNVYIGAGPFRLCCFITFSFCCSGVCREGETEGDEDVGDGVVPPLLLPPPEPGNTCREQALYTSPSGSPLNSSQRSPNIPNCEKRREASSFDHQTKQVKFVLL